jgi:hypothetical protein
MSGLGGRVCTTCSHPHRHEIDAALVAGASIAVLARQYGLQDDAISRHRKRHLPAASAAAAVAAVQRAVEEEARGDGLLQVAEKIRDKAIGLLEQAERSGDMRSALAGCREALRAVEIMSKLTGAIQTAPVMNVSITSNSITVVQQAILQALADEPAARAKVVAALAEIEAQGGG